MENNVLATIIQEGSRMATELLKTRGPSHSAPATLESLEKFVQDTNSRFTTLSAPASPEPVANLEPAPIRATAAKPQPAIILAPQDDHDHAEGKAAAIATGCVPCAMGHFGTCSGVLNESLRFAHGKEGLASPEVIDRVNMCMDELNAMERIDLRPEMTVQLVGWEKDLAQRALTESRNVRHMLEAISNVDDLEKAAATTQTTRNDIGRQWFQKRLSAMTPDDKEEIHRRVMAKLDEMATTESGEES